MPEHELWLTALFNDYLAGLGTAVLTAVHRPVPDPAHPWSNWMVMELFVVFLLMVTVAILRSGLSVEKPGTLQHLFESIWDFVRTTAADVGVHHPEKYEAFFGTLFIFILAMNLIGLIPTLESPTMSPYVAPGLAICTFIYYNVMGVKEMGLGKYLAHFAGPIWWIAWLMIPVEIISHMARLVSLSFRLYGNMLAGEQVTSVFIRLTYIIIPVIFMALHVFVAFLQAYIFMLLAMIYVSFATAHDSVESHSA